jgi:hypothetical protein
MWGIIAFVAVLLLGDYLGYKVGRKSLAKVTALIALVVVVAFAITAAVLLLGR